MVIRRLGTLHAMVTETRDCQVNAGKFLQSRAEHCTFLDISNGSSEGFKPEDFSWRLQLLRVTDLQGSKCAPE